MGATLKKNRSSQLGGRSRSRVGSAKRLGWMVREARCIAKPGAEWEILERLVQEEVERMHRLGIGVETIAEFQAAAAVHIALRGGGPVD